MSLKVIETLPINLKVANALPGYRHLGFPAGGASDERLSGIAAALVGTAVNGFIEVRGPLKLQFQESCVIGVSTWNSVYELNGKSQKGHTRISGEAGQVLIFDRIAGLTVIAGIDFALQSGTEKLGIGEVFDGVVSSRQIGTWRIAADLSSRTNSLRWIPVAELEVVSGKVEAASRIGVRMAAGQKGSPASSASEASTFGVVQVTPDGTILIHGVDGPTIGGYEKIGAVIQADLWKLGSLMGGEILELVPVALNDARESWKEESEWRTQVKEHIRQVLKNLSPNA